MHDPSNDAATLVKIRMKTLVVVLLILGFLVAPTVVMAEGSGDTEVCETSDETCVLPNQVFGPLGPPTEYLESSKGIRLAVRRWLPDDTVKSVVVVQHGGAGWHSGYFDVLGQDLKAHGIAVIAYDQVGCGYSDSMEPSRFYFDSMETINDDLKKVIHEARKYGTKVFVLGESFGGMMVLHHILRGATADGYVLCGPVVRIADGILPPYPVQVILKFLSRYFPLLKLPVVDVSSSFDEAFGDKRWAAAGKADPIVQESLSTSPRLGMLGAVIGTQDEIGSSAEQVNVPFVIYLGEKDVRINVPAVHKLYEKATSKDKTLHIVEGGYHQLFQDRPEVTAKVVQGIREWVLARS